jgi:membrane associated rhomboid family serine protease
VFDPVDIYRSQAKKPCRERALVLRALGIPFRIARMGADFVLLVPASMQAQAESELADWEEENRDWPPREERPPNAPGALPAGVLYAALLVLLYFFSTGGALDLDWRSAGVAHAAAIRDGELWRALTALGLHSGPPHLLSNLVFGTFFAVLVAWTHGGGIGWLGILVGAFLGNVSNAWLLDPSHHSIGASTAVFAAVGMIVGAEWRRRVVTRMSRLRRLAVPLMGLLLYSMLGIGGERTDITAHLTGLLWGVPIGALLVHLPQRLVHDLRAQRIAGAIALLLFACAWCVGLLAA